MGFKNARHTAYDWFGSHQYQRYFTEDEIINIFLSLDVPDSNIIRLHKGLYKIRKDQGVELSNTRYSFGNEDSRFASVEK
ncbi:MAG TPA: hypothetical protein ENI62_06205 [Gammaproteobacteria bacterium]|nr:hypothetical protein [Gammaproteobacteria bacterium]